MSADSPCRCGHPRSEHVNGFGQVRDCGRELEAGFCACAQFSAATPTTEKTANAIDAHVRCKCSKCGHEGDVWIDPGPLFVARINDMVFEGLAGAADQIEVARQALLRALDFRGSTDNSTSIRAAIVDALNQIGWNAKRDSAMDKAFGDLGPVCGETGIYKSRCTHCGAEPLNATAGEASR